MDELIEIIALISYDLWVEEDESKGNNIKYNYVLAKVHIEKNQLCKYVKIQS